MIKSLQHSILKRTLLIAVCLSVITWVVTKDVMMASGFIIGAIARLAGFMQIVRMTSRIENYDRPKAVTSSNYVTRLIFYGIVIWICMDAGVNVLTLLLGFVSMNIAILVTTYFENRKESE